jgi:hypothetical protein
MKKITDFKKLVLGSAGTKRVKEGNWDFLGFEIKKKKKRGVGSKFYWGDKDAGYKLRELSNGRHRVSIYNRGKVVRTDDIPTKKEAEEWIKYRRKKFYGV